MLRDNFYFDGHIYHVCSEGARSVPPMRDQVSLGCVCPYPVCIVLLCLRLFRVIACVLMCTQGELFRNHLRCYPVSSEDPGEISHIVGVLSSIPNENDEERVGSSRGTVVPAVEAC